MILFVEFFVRLQLFVVGGWFIWTFRADTLFWVLVLLVCFSFCGRSVDALVSRADERRGGLRYASGS